MPPPEPVAVGHEPDAMPLRWLVYALALLLTLGVVTGFGIRGLLSVLAHQPRAVDAPRSVVDHVVPARDGPPLQPSIGHDTSPTRDLATMRANEDRVFAALGWTVDGATGLPTVPPAIVAAVATRATTSRPATREVTR